MPLELLIDGYNLIKQSPDLSQLDALDLQEGREALIERLAAYKRIRGHRITVVFDGWGSLHTASQHVTQRGIKLVFTKQGETADMWIEKRLVDLEEGAVVTSDREIRDRAMNRGVTVISSAEFERKMEDAVYFDMKGLESGQEDRIRPIKKGSARRPSKRERKKRAIWERL